MFSLSIPHISDSAVAQKLVYGDLQIFLERQPRASSVRLPMSTHSVHFIWLGYFALFFVVCILLFVFYLFVCFCSESDMISSHANLAQICRKSRIG